MRKRFLLFALSLGAVSLSFAQEQTEQASTASPKYWKFRERLDSYFGLMAAYNSPTNLNALVRSHNFKSAPNFQFGLGLGLGYDIKPIVLGLNLDGGLTFSEQSRSHFTYVGLYASTNEWKAKSTVISPFVGFGLQSAVSRYRIKEDNLTASDLFASNRGNIIELNQDSPVLDFGIALKKHKPGKGNFQFLRLGYRLGLKDADWDLAGNTQDAGVTDRTQMGYLLLSF